MRRILFYLKFLIVKKSVIHYYNSLLKFDKLTENDKKSIVNDSFIKLYRHAFSNSKFLKKKYTEAGLDIDSVKSIDDIKKIPYLTRDEIINHKEDILAVKKTRHISSPTTGGTTGIPMKFYRDNSLPFESFYLFYLKNWHIKPYSNSLYLWRLKKKSFLSKILNKIFWFPTIKMKIDGTLVNLNKAKYIIKKLNKHRPQLIQGYVGCLVELSKIMIDNNIFLNYKPKAIWTTAAPITIFEKKLINTAFKSSIFDEYGSAEIPWIAFQKFNESDLLYVNNYARFLEIINKDDNGFGEIVITDFFDFSFPKIRYKNGDKSKFDKNSTIFTTIINPVLGRKSDYLLIPKVGKIDGSYLTTVFNKYCDSVNGFQFIQNDLNEIKLMVIPNLDNEDHKLQIDKVVNDLNIIFDNNIKLNVFFVKKLKYDRGKIRYVIRSKKLDDK
tara:strand:- start:11427 stop:12746 length:1320 start_codon:yes stop_codon:yes gene_type:complete